MQKRNDIAIIAPFVVSSVGLQWMKEAYHDVTGVDIVGIDEGKDPLVTFSDVELNITSMLNRLVLAEKEGYRAAIIGCFGDPGLIAARQLVSIPVVGPGEATLAVASTLGDRIFVIEPSRDLAYATERMIYSYGHRNKVVGVRSLDEKGAEACITRSEEGVRKITEMCLQAVNDLGAHVIVLGCMMLCWLVNEIDRFLNKNEVSCPIIEPGIISIEYTKMLLSLGLNQSREMFRM
jgi:allantoin racemase